MTEQDLIIQDLRRENAELRASAPKWISVEDMLPEQGEEAICVAADGDMMIGKYTEWGWMFPCSLVGATKSRASLFTVSCRKVSYGLQGMDKRTYSGRRIDNGC